MPQLTQQARGSITQHINRVLDLLSQNKKLARKATEDGNLPDVQKLAKARSDIRHQLEELIELRDHVYITSGMPSDQAEARLSQSADSARAIARTATNVAKTLTAIAKMGDLITALLGVFKAV